MAFSASHIEIALFYTALGQNCMTARCYTWDGAAIAAATPEQVGEAWWNHYKAAWRALVPPGTDNAQFLSVRVREVGGGLAAGEYAIPTGEQQGTRSGVTVAQLPTTTAVGVRLTVGSRITRPGQFRVTFLNGEDYSGNDISPAYLEEVADLADLYSQPNIMGAPIATGVIAPVVVRFGADADTIEASNPIIGFVVNPHVTSQVSRRYGHGS